MPIIKRPAYFLFPAFTLLILLMCFDTHAQPWMKPPYYTNIHPDSTRPVLLRDVQEAFEAWQNDHINIEDEGTAAPKGDEEEEQRPGWLQFKRWEHFMTPRVYPSGDVSLPSKNYQIYKDYVNSLSPNQGHQTSGPLMSALTGGWVAKGPNSVPSGGGAGRINFIRFNPLNSNTIWIGSPSGGLWKSTNAGGTWSTNTDALSVIGSSDIDINPLDTSIMYLATGDGENYANNSIGVLKSTDGGNTWNTTGLVWPVSSYYIIRKMIMNPNDTAMIILASNDGIYLTTNSGVSWTKVQAGDFTDIAFKPGTPSTIYAVSTTFYISTNSGTTFTQSATGLPTTNVERLEIGVSAANSAYVYVLASNNTHSGFLGLYLSTNSGTSFTTKSTTPNILGYDTNGADTAAGQGWYDLSIVVNPTNASDVYVAGINHWRSTNAGASWTCLTQWYGCCGYPYVHADVHNLSFLPGSGTTIFSGNDGGIFESTNNGTAWTDHSSNLEIAEMYALGMAATDSNLTITGHQDNGTNLLDGSSWSYVIGGDGMDCLIDIVDSNIMYGEIYYGEIYKSTNKGGTFNSITNSAGTGVNAQGDWVTPYIMNPTSDSTLLVGKYQIFRTTNAGTTWAQLGTLPIDSPDVIIALAYAPSNPAYIYAATSNQLFLSTNSGATYTNITGTLPVASASITNMAVSNTNPAKVWVTFSGYSSGNKVYASSNAGSTWTNYSTGLPNLPADCIAYQNNTNDGLYVGMDVGVYFISNSLTSWQAYNTSLPNVVVDDLEIQYQMNKIGAATYGRGLWQSGLAIPVAAFTANLTTTCTGTTVAFTDQSVGSPTGWNWTLTGATPSSSTSENPSVSYSAPGTYAVTLTVSNANGTDTARKTSYITIVAASVGGTATASAPSICTGSTATLSLAGNTGTIQWQSSPNGTTYSNISGATSATYITPALTSTTYYRAVVTNGICASANSTIDTVAVSPHSVGGTVTATSNILCSGSATTITLAGNTGSIQWQSSPNGTTFTNITGQTSASYPTPTLTSTTYYRAVVTSGVCAAVNSTTDTVTVNPVSIGGTVSASGDLCSGNATTITLTGNTGNIQWQSSPNNTTFTNIGGATSASYLTPVLTSTTYYRAIVTSGVCASANSTTDTVTIIPVSVGGTATATNNTLCSGNSTSITLTGNTGSIQWQSSPNNLTFTNIAGATSATYSTPALTSTTYYRAVVTNGVCLPGNSTTATVTVNPVSVGGISTAASYILCSGNTTTITLTGSTGSIQWQSSPDDVTFTNISGATSGSYLTPVLTSTTYYRAIVTSGVCASAISTIDTVTVNPVSAGGTAIATNSTLCSGNSTTITLSGNTGNIQWQSSPNNTTFTNVGGATSPSYLTPNLTSTTYYRAIVTSGVCASVNSNTDTVTINPVSVGGTASATNSTLCSGNSTTITLTGNSGNIQWQSSPDNITFTNINGATSTSYITGVLTATTYYRAVVTSGVCAPANSNTAIVTVSPVSIGGTSTASNNTLCTGGSTIITLSGSTGAVQWQSSVNNITFTNIAGATSTTYATPILTSTTYYRAVVTSGVCALANSTTDTITINPVSIGGTAIATNSTLCSGNSTTITLTGSTGNVQWQSSPNGTTFANIGGATSASYPTPALTSTTYYRAVVTSGACTAANSTIDTVTINPVSVGGTANAILDSLCSGNSTTLSLTGNTGSIQWQASANNVTFTNISGATSATYLTPALTSTTYYRVVVTSGVCASANSTTATIKVLATTVINAQPLSQNSCVGGQVVFNVTASGSNLNYQWLIDGNNITGATLPAYTIASASVTDSGGYSVIVSGSCGSITSGTAVLTITQSLEISQQPVSQSVCLGNPVTFSVVANGSSVHYQWMKGASNLIGATSQTYTVNAVSIADSGAYVCSITSSCGDTLSLVGQLVVLQPTTYTYSYSICHGSFYNFNGQQLAATGIYTDTLQAANGCDSINYLHLTSITPDSTFTSASICSGNVYNFNGRGLTLAGTYVDTLVSVLGCDSVVILNLRTPATFNQHTTATICEGASYQFNGQPISIAGNYTDTLTSSSGCDSIINLELSVTNPSKSTLNASLCEGNIYQFNGQPLTVAGTYVDTVLTTGGCDSIVTLHLAVTDVSDSAIVSGAECSAVQAGAIYQWVNCGSGQNISGATSQSYTATQNGTYQCLVTIGNCTDRTNCVTAVVNGIEPVSDYSFDLYPNPNTGSFMIVYDYPNPLHVRIVSTIGDIVTDLPLNKSGDRFDISSLAAGVYNVMILEKNQLLKTIKVVKQ